MNHIRRSMGIILWVRSLALGLDEGADFAGGGEDDDSRGNVFVADFYNHRVQTFAADGAVFVADFANNRVQKWRPKGE